MALVLLGQRVVLVAPMLQSVILVTPRLQSVVLVTPRLECGTCNS